jgi:3-hydroxyacyl-[acyl-carrier-protein] dehydratase
MRFFLVDRIEVIDYGKYIVGVKAVSLAEDVFNEHFPGLAVFPGSLIVEGAAQLAGSFFELSIAHQGLPQKRCALSIINRFKFRRPVVPGDRLVYTVQTKTMQADYGVVTVEAAVENAICAEGKLTFVFLDVENETLHSARMALYDQWLRGAQEVVR